MRYLILSDIHDNLEAFKRILEKVKSLAIDKVIFLGDILGYGANPVECLALARKYGDYFLFGNHEHAVIRREDEEHFSLQAMIAIEWTRDRLSKKEIDSLRTFDIIKEIDGVTFTHGSPRDPEEFDYIMSAVDADRAFRHFTTRICFVGHTHVPQLFVEGEKKGYYLTEGIHALDPSQRYIINGGSVGQPREKDKRLSCVVYDSSEHTIEIIRLAYDNKKAAEKIRKAGLPDMLADRLL